MLYNYKDSFRELEEKRRKCWEWQVTVTNCRYRPLNQLYDEYHGLRISQTSDDYYIHPNWTHDEVRKFGTNVRRHNMCIRFNTLFHSKKMQYKKISKELSNKCRHMTPSEASKYLDDVWNPAEYHGVDDE